MRGLLAAVGLKLVVASGLVLFVLLVFILGIHVVPPISAKVVDAVSGKPLAGMNVCLEVTVRDWGRPVTLRSEETQTDASGRFSFSWSLHTHAMQAWQGYSIRITDPKTDLVPHCGPFLNGAYFSSLVYGRPVSPLDEGGRPFYFPVAVVHEPPQQVSLGFNAVRREMGFPFGGKIALIPLLNNAYECRPIEDSSLAASCRELNGSAAASSLRAASAGMPVR